MNRAELLKDKRVEILRVATRRGAKNLRVFGSVARGEAGPNSDIDLLVDLESERSLIDLGGLLTDLEDLLKCEVHLVTEPALHWYIRDHIVKEAVPL